MKAKRFYKIVSTAGHRGMFYRNGVNEDIVPFNEEPTCGSGGLYFSDLHNILNFLGYGTQLYEVVPIGKVIEVNDKYKAHVLDMTFICEGYLETIKYLIDNGADIHANNDGALRWAAENGYLEIVKYLVDNGADLHAGDDYALRLAALNGYWEIVKYLVDNGADIHASDGCALRLAARNGHLEIVKYLIDNGADIHANGDCALNFAAKNVREYFHDLMNK